MVCYWVRDVVRDVVRDAVRDALRDVVRDAVLLLQRAPAWRCGRTMCHLFRIDEASIKAILNRILTGRDFASNNIHNLQF